VSEALDRYLNEIRRDCERLLGPGSEVLGLARQDADDGVHLVLRCG
jgi:hypothetical protein